MRVLQAVVLIVLISFVALIPQALVGGNGWAQDEVPIADVIQLLKDTSEHLAKFDYPAHTTSEYDACTHDYICARQRELDRKRRERDVAKRIDAMIERLDKSLRDQ